MFILYLLLFLTAPLYVWRFSIGGLPTNFLMLAAFVVIAAGSIELLARKLWPEFVDHVRSLPRTLLGAMALITVASVISLMAFGPTMDKIGQWVVLYAQPLAIFLLLSFYAHRRPQVVARLQLAAYVLLIVAGTVAMWQYFTLDALPPAWQGNSAEPKRAISFFAHPNAFALFVTPILAWLIPDLVRRTRAVWQLVWENVWRRQTNVLIGHSLAVLAWLVGACGLFLSLSRGAWLGIAAAAAVYALFSANRKVLVTFAAIGVIIAALVVSVPNLRWRVLLPFYGEKSSVARISLWETGSKMIFDSPVLGKGISGFDTNWEEYNTDPNLDHYNFPHNIVLNFWVDLGLLGLAGFAVLMIWSVGQGVARRRDDLAMGLLLFITALVVHGLIDIPYLKNDLALVFWMVIAISTTIIVRPRTPGSVHSTNPNLGI